MTISDRIAELEASRGLTQVPDDFNGFWQRMFELAKPCSISIEDAGFAHAPAEYRTLAIKTAGDILSARLIKPLGEGPYPTVLMFHDVVGHGIRGWHHMTRFAALGYAVLALQGPKTIDLRDVHELERAYMGALTAAQAVALLPNLDAARLAAWGEGFGGGMAILISAMMPQPVRCAALNPMPANICAHVGSDASADGLAYYDLAGFAPLLHGDLLMGTSLMDEIAPPEGQYAIFNRAACLKEHLVYPKYAHERINFFENELVRFLHPLQKGQA